jgi:hypothetical protein
VDEKSTIRLPGPQDRLAIFGTTGSGKTVGALWHLSAKNFDAVPWMAYDPSGDKNIRAIDRAEIVGLDFIPKKKGGLYIVDFLPSDGKKLEENLGKVMERGGIGVYIDEGFLSGHTEALFNIIVAGRKNNIPAIYLAQRPVEKAGSPVVTMVSCAEFIQVYELPFESDWDRIEELIPQYGDERKKQIGMEVTQRRYHSIYYDRRLRKVSLLGPVPKVETIVDKINSKLGTRRKKI